MHRAAGMTAGRVVELPGVQVSGVVKPAKESMQGGSEP